MVQQLWALLLLYVTCTCVSVERRQVSLLAVRLLLLRVGTRGEKSAATFYRDANPDRGCFLPNARSN